MHISYVTGNIYLLMVHLHCEQNIQVTYHALKIRVSASHMKGKTVDK